MSKTRKSLTAAIAAGSMLIAATAAEARTRTVVFCGFGFMPFCVGMDTVAYRTGGTLHDWYAWKAVADSVIRERPKEVSWAGFSCGVMAGQLFEAELRRAGIRVKRSVQVDGDTFVCPTTPVPRSKSTLCINQPMPPLGMGGGINCSTRFYGPPLLAHIVLSFDQGVAQESVQFLQAGRRRR